MQYFISTGQREENCGDDIDEDSQHLSENMETDEIEYAREEKSPSQRLAVEDSAQISEAGNVIDQPHGTNNATNSVVQARTVQTIDYLSLHINEKKKKNMNNDSCDTLTQSM